MRWIDVPVMKQHCSVALGWAVKKEASLAGFICDSVCFEQAGHIVAKANSFLKNTGDAGYDMRLAHFELTNFTACVKSSIFDFVKPRSLIRQLSSFCLGQ